MTTKELIKNLKSESYGFPFFRKQVEEGRFFNSEIRRDIEKRSSDTLVFNRKIEEVFEIKDTRFEECYDAVINGEGGEKRKIHSLRSSSLLGLLSFYKVHSGQPVEMDRTINGNHIHFLLDKVVFEKTNRVFHPSLGLSSIDVALYGTSNGEPCVLYLESKFTEYLKRKDMIVRSSKDGKETYPISSKYAEYYQSLLPGFPGLSYSVYEKGICLFSNDGKTHYCDGIKQMISHYIGAKNSEDLFKGLKVYLGTILFDFSLSKSNVDPDKKILGDYCALYTEIAKRMNAIGHKNLTVIEDAWTYQDFFAYTGKYQLDPLVKEYYLL
jgi:hypothetical protein